MENLNMTFSDVPENYFSEKTLSHLKPQQRLSERYQHRAIDVTLAAKLTLTYGKYHLAMLHRQLAMSEEQTTYQQAERQAAMINQRPSSIRRQRTLCTHRRRAQTNLSPHTGSSSGS